MVVTQFRAEMDKSFLTLLGTLGCPTPETVLQQLMSTCGTGPCHQTHSGLMQEHLEGGGKQKTMGSVYILATFHHLVVL